MSLKYNLIEKEQMNIELNSFDLIILEDLFDSILFYMIIFPDNDSFFSLLKRNCK